MGLDKNLRTIAERWDLLQHEFYQRWVSGELTRDELSEYAGQYRHLVAAIPRWLETAAAGSPAHASVLREHAAEEERHIGLWDQFAEALGISGEEVTEAAPNRATADLIERGDVYAEAGYGAAVVWAVESQSPAVAREKLRGLEAHYGIGPDSGAQYFDLHRKRDMEHERSLRHVMEEEGSDVVELAPAVAGSMLTGLWAQLSSVSRPS